MRAAGVRALAAAALVAFGSAAAAQAPDPAAVCRAAEATPPPHAGSAGTPAPGCDALALYYGIGRTPDARAARACALDGDGAEQSVGFENEAILAMIFANGDGVARNDDLAIAYACEAGGANAEIAGRIAHLLERRRQGAAAKGRFDFCDDITSGLMQGACAGRDSRIAAAARDVRLAALARPLSSRAAGAFAALRKAEEAYVAAVGNNEVDLAGTGRGAFIVEAEEAEHAAFMDLLALVLSGKPMARAPDALAGTDAELNAVYRKVQGASDFDIWGTVTKDGIRTAEAAWIVYRDRFVAFAKAAAPQVAPEALAARLTAQRTENLREFLPRRP